MAAITTLAFAGLNAQAQLAITSTSATYTIDFDNTVNGVNNGAWAGTGFEPGAPTAGRLDSNAWAATGMSDGALAFGGTRTTGDYARGVSGGGVTTGGFYAFSGGNITTGSTLGIQQTGTDWENGTVTLRLRNDTASIISGFEFDYTVWVNNNDSRSTTVSSLHSANDATYAATGAADVITGAAADGLGFVSTSPTATFAGLSIAPGAFYYLRWTGVSSGSGGRDEFAFDNIILSNFTTTALAGRDLVWNGTVGSPSWDGASANWLDAAAAATWNDITPDNAVFDATSPVKAVTLASPRTAGKITFNDTGYALSGAALTLRGAGGAGVVANESASISAPVVVDGDQTWEVADTKTLSATGATSGSGRLVKIGPGTLVLGNAGNGHLGTTINAGAVEVSSDGALGVGELFMSGGALRTTASFNSPRTINFTAASTIDTGAHDVELSGDLYGPGGFTKLGAGTLTLSNASDAPPLNYSGITNVNQGTVKLTAQINNFSALGSGDVIVNNSGTLQIDNIQVGIPGGSASSRFFLGNGSTLVGTGNAIYARSGGALHVYRGTDPLNPNVTTIRTINPTDVFTFKNSFRQWDLGPAPFNVGPSNAVIRVDGPGRIIQESGATTSETTFAGNWEIHNGTLQIGPVEPNPTPVDPTNLGPFGEPLNALGFIAPAAVGLDGTNDGDPDLPVPVTVLGGVLAVGVDAPNTNPNITNAPRNPTPNYLRNHVTLAGGAIASTGSRVSYGASPTDPQGVPTGVPVEAQFGGDFTVAAGTSKVLVYDPVIDGSLDGPRNVHLVGGTRTLPNDSPGFLAGSVITYTTNWIGTLQVDPGATPGGAFHIHRTAGTVNVTPGATLEVMSGASVTLNGANALSDGTDHVAVVNNSTTTFAVQSGVHQVASLSGVGNTLVSGAGTVLEATHVRQNALTVGAGAAARVRAGGGDAGTSKLSSLSLSGLLDLTDHALVVTSAPAAIDDAVTAGFNGGLWDGASGITSGLAASDPDGVHALGFASNAELGLGDFGGQPAGPADMLVIYTLYGDLDLDRDVDGDDFTLFGAGYNHEPGTSPTWLYGDLDFDNDVDGDDFTLFGAGYSYFQANGFGGGGGPAPVPEPGTLGLLAAGAFGLLGRRRRGRRVHCIHR